MSLSQIYLFLTPSFSPSVAPSGGVLQNNNTPITQDQRSNAESITKQYDTRVQIQKRIGETNDLTI